LKFEVPTHYVSEELVAAAARTDLQTEGTREIRVILCAKEPYYDSSA